MCKICVIDWQSYPSLCDTLFSVYSMIRHYGFYPKRMIRHYVIHPTNYVNLSYQINIIFSTNTLKCFSNAILPSFMTGWRMIGFQRIDNELCAKFMYKFWKLNFMSFHIVMSFIIDIVLCIYAYMLVFGFSWIWKYISYVPFLIVLVVFNEWCSEN